MIAIRSERWAGVAAFLGGALFAVTSWLGRVPTDSALVTSLWLLAPLLLLGGIYGLATQSVVNPLGKAGLALCALACLLLLLGGAGMRGTGASAAFALYASGVLVMPIGLLLYGGSSDGLSTPIRHVALLTALLTGPGAIALELSGLYPELGWTMWSVGTGVGWFVIGALMSRSSANRQQLQIED